MYFFRTSTNKPTLNIDLAAEKITPKYIVDLLNKDFLKGDEFAAMNVDLHSKLELKDKHDMLDYCDVVIPKLQAAKKIVDGTANMQGIVFTLSALILKAQEIETKASDMPEKKGTLRPHGRGHSDA